MKKQKTTHKERVEKIKAFASKNRAFVIFAVLICVYLIGNAVMPGEKPKQEVAQTEIVQQQEPEHWRFTGSTSGCWQSAAAFARS